MNKYKIVGTFQREHVDTLRIIHEVSVINEDKTKNTSLVVITALFPNLIGLAVFFENHCYNCDITSITKC